MTRPGAYEIPSWAIAQAIAKRGVDQRRQADSRPLAEGSADPLVAPSLPYDALP